MNKTAILQVADAIEFHAIADLGFNMADYRRTAVSWPDQSGHNCDTVSCIAGWVVAVLEPESIRQPSAGFFNLAAYLLNISRLDANELFLGEGRDGENLFQIDGEQVEFTNTIPAQAARVLRNFVATGKIDWPAALAE